MFRLGCGYIFIMKRFKKWFAMRESATTMIAGSAGSQEN